MGCKKSLRFFSLENLMFVGYAVTSGRYFDNKTTHFAVSAPRDLESTLGKVSICDVVKVAGRNYLSLKYSNFLIFANILLMGPGEHKSNFKSTISRIL